MDKPQRSRLTTKVNHDLEMRAPGRIRTCDPQYRKLMLYPLSYGGLRRRGYQPQPLDRATIQRLARGVTVIVDCALYRKGIRQEVPATAALAVDIAGLGAEDFIWLGVVDPTSHELDHLAERFDLHPLAVEDALKAHQRPKLEIFDNFMFMVVKTLGYDEPTSQVESGEVAFFVGAHFIVTVRHGHVHPLLHLRAKLEAQTEQMAKGPSVVLHAVLDDIVDAYLNVVLELEADVENIEREVLGRGSHTRTNDIYLLKREIIECRRATGPLIEPLTKLTTDPLHVIDDGIQPFFADIADHVLRAHDGIDALNELITAALHVSLAHIQVRQNEDMRRISAWVALVAVPTMVAGIYGMNFTHMPELDWTWSYPTLLLFLMTESSLLYRYFKRNGWL